ncbi:hypothetical protein IWX90DRAFT_88284 [Phyllosticta citrichinensis]|uniref:Uncharacterized protein n=1 Tax=Phyllosticta citrichinensis TaxID=1130410 RepID=A0ABR1XFM7_9PEZI
MTTPSLPVVDGQGRKEPASSPLTAAVRVFLTSALHLLPPSAHLTLASTVRLPGPRPLSVSLHFPPSSSPLHPPASSFAFIVRFPGPWAFSSFALFRSSLVVRHQQAFPRPLASPFSGRLILFLSFVVGRVCCQRSCESCVRGRSKISDTTLYDFSLVRQLRPHITSEHKGHLSLLEPKYEMDLSPGSIGTGTVLRLPSVALYSPFARRSPSTSLTPLAYRSSA